MDPRTEKMLAENAQKTAAIPPNLRGSVRALNEAKAWIKVNRTLARVGAVAGVIVLFAAYYVFVTMPAERRDQQEIAARAADRLRAEVSARQMASDDCLSKAQADAEERWTAACKTHKDRPGCALPERQMEALQQQESQARNACLIRLSVSSQ